MATGRLVIHQSPRYETRVRHTHTTNHHMLEAYRYGLEGREMPQWIKSDVQYRRRWVDQSEYITDGRGMRYRRTAGYWEVSHAMPGPYLKEYRKGLKRAGHEVPELANHIAGQKHRDKAEVDALHIKQQAALEAALREMGLPVNAQTIGLARG